MSEVLVVLGVILGGVVLIVAVAAGIVIVGIRTRNRRILRGIRRFNKAFTNRAQLRIAGKEGAEMGLLHHRGRTSGREYVTPIGPSPVPGGFAVVLPYGTDTDWIRNLRAAGSGTLQFDGSTYRVTDPEVVPIETTPLMAREGAAIRLLKVRHALQFQAKALSGPD